MGTPPHTGGAWGLEGVSSGAPSSRNTNKSIRHPPFSVYSIRTIHDSRIRYPSSIPLSPRILFSPHPHPRCACLPRRSCRSRAGLVLVCRRRLVALRARRVCVLRARACVHVSFLVRWNSWNKFRTRINETLIKNSADALVSTGLAALGYNYLNIDDHWQAARRDPTGRLQADPFTFPSGMRALGEYIHGKGLKFGIYSAAGAFTCAHRPGSLESEEVDAASFAEWNVDYLKFDNCFTPIQLTVLRQTRMSRAIKKQKREIYFGMCEWGWLQPARWGPAISDSWRTAKDIEDHFHSMMYNAERNNRWADSAGPGRWNDPDMLQVGNGGMSTSEYRIHFGLWALMKAPLLIGTDIENMSDDTRSILMNNEVIGINQDSMQVQGRKIRDFLGTQVWAGPLSNKRIVVAFVNKDKKDRVVRVPWLQLGLLPFKRMKVRDVWKKETRSGFATRFLKANVAARDIAVFILSPV